MIQNLINHIYLVLDRSGSMQGKPVAEVVDAAIEKLKQRSVELDQETRISIYLFDDVIEVLVFDMDVMRFKTMKGHWAPRGGTAMRDAIGRAIEEGRKIPHMYGDHAHLMYVITDGEENRSVKVSNSDLHKTITSLPEDWTVACLVPNASGKFEAKKFGIPEDCIAIWDIHSSKGFEEVGRQFADTYSSYTTMRASGTRSTRSLFKMDVGNLKKSDLVPLTPGSYETAKVRYDIRIDEFVENVMKRTFRIGAGYYQLAKKVKVQDYKNIIVRDEKTQKYYSGSDIRQLLGLPDYTVEVDPAVQIGWTIFVQSTSVNRKLLAGTDFVLMR